MATPVTPQDFLALVAEGTTTSLFSKLARLVRTLSTNDADVTAVREEFQRLSNLCCNFHTVLGQVGESAAGVNGGEAKQVAEAGQRVLADVLARVDRWVKLDSASLQRNLARIRKDIEDSRDEMDACVVHFSLVMKSQHFQLLSNFIQEQRDNAEQQRQISAQAMGLLVRIADRFAMNVGAVNTNPDPVQRDASETSEVRPATATTLYDQDSPVLVPKSPESPLLIARAVEESIPQSPSKRSSPNLPSRESTWSILVGWTKRQSSTHADEPIKDISHSSQTYADASMGHLTLHDLVESVILWSSNAADSVRRDDFFIAYRAVTTCSTILDLLVKLFGASERDYDLASSREARRKEILLATKHWVAGPGAPSEPQIAGRIKDFTYSILNSEAMSLEVRGLAMDIHVRVDMDTDPEPSPRPQSLGSPTDVRRLLDAEPKQIACALVTFEARLHGRIRAVDCIPFAQRQGHPRVEAAQIANDRIFYWVQSKILCSDSERRRLFFNFFVYVSQECRKMRNFSSMSAIVRALNSPHIQSLPLTRSSFAKGNKKLFKRLTALIAPDRHFQNYREELYSSAKPCVPWLYVHLRELSNLVPPVLHSAVSDGQDMVNYSRCVELASVIRKNLRLKVNANAVCDRGILAFLEKQLYGVRLEANIDSELRDRSSKFLEEENADLDARVRELDALGLPRH